MGMSQNVLNPQLNLLRHDLELTGNRTGENCRETDVSGGIPGLCNHSSTRRGGMGHEQLVISKMEFVINKKGNSYFGQNNNFGGKVIFFLTEHQKSGSYS